MYPAWEKICKYQHFINTFEEIEFKWQLNMDKIKTNIWCLKHFSR